MANIKFPHYLSVSGGTPSSIISIEVTFQDIPSSPSIMTAKVKHDKSAVILYQKDDATPDDLTVFKPLFQTLFGTDGAYKKRNYRASLALNAGGHETVSDQILDYIEMESILDDEHSISNHGFNHGGTDIYHEVKNAEIRIWDKMKELGKQVRVRTVVTPTNDEGYIETPFYLGYGNFTSSYGFPYTSRDGNEVFYGNVPISTLNKGKMMLGRDYMGNGFEYITEAKGWVDQLFSGSTISDPKVRSFFSHNMIDTVAITRYSEFWNYVMNHTDNNDRLLVESQQDFFEYYETINNTTISSGLTGNKLTINLNQSGISGNNYRRDMSLLVSGGTIKSINVINADGSTFNPFTGLINIYKTNKNVSDPNLDPIPPRINSLVRNLTQLTVNFDRSVTGNTGFEIIGATISGITGSGNTLVISCTGNVPVGNNFYYRIQNGNIADAANNNLKLCSYINHLIP